MTGAPRLALRTFRSSEYPVVSSVVDRADWPEPSSVGRPDDGAYADANPRRNRRWCFRRSVGYGSAGWNGAGHPLCNPDVQYRKRWHGRRCRVVDGASARWGPVGRRTCDCGACPDLGNRLCRKFHLARLDLRTVAVQTARWEWSCVGTCALL